MTTPIYTPPAQAPWAPPAPPAKPRRALWISLGAVGVLLLAFVVLLALGIAGQTHSKNLIAANFNDGHGPFNTDSDPTVTLRYADGAYQMVLAQPGPQSARAFFNDGTESRLRIEADATLRPCPGSCSAALQVWNGKTADYMLVYEPSLGAAILKEADATTTGEKEVLTEHAVPTTDRVHLVLEVRGGGASPTSLTAWVNGQKLQTSDANGYDSFAGIGLWAGADKTPATITWDNVKARSLSD